MAPFFAKGKTFSVAAGGTAVVDEFVGMLETDGNADAPFDEALHCLLTKYAAPPPWTPRSRRWWTSGTGIPPI